MKLPHVFAAIAVLVAACDPPPPKEKTPEHLACLTTAEQYLSCKTNEAAGLDETMKKPIMRAVEANRRKANISQAKCESVLAAVPGDDSCKPQ